MRDLISLLVISLLCIFVAQKAIAQVPTKPEFAPEPPPLASFGLYAFKEGGKYGIKNGDDEILVSPRYDTLVKKVRGFKYVGFKMEGKFGLLHKAKEIIPPTYEDMKPFSEGMIPVKKDGKWGYINAQNEVLIPFDFEEVNSFNSIFISRSNEYYYTSAKKDGKWGLIDKKGVFLLQPAYDEFKFVYKHKVLARKENHWGTLNPLTTEILVPVEYDTIRTTNKQWIVHKDGLQGLFQGNGEQLTPIQYQDIQKQSHDALIFKLDDKYGVCQPNTLQNLACEYENIQKDIWYYRVSKNGKIGWLKASGEIHIPLIYDEVLQFKAKQGISLRKGNKWGKINDAGTIIHPFTSDKPIY